MKNLSEPVLGYWRMQGSAQPIRYVFEYFNIPYSEKHYEDWEDWSKEKFRLGLEFPNLPYLIDNEYRITESSAILEYPALKAKQPRLLGGDDLDRLKVKELIGVLTDVKKEIFNVVLGDKVGWQDRKKECMQKIDPKLNYLNKFLGSANYLLGYVTIADFTLFYLLDLISNFETEIGLKQYTNLKLFLGSDLEIFLISKSIEVHKDLNA